MLKNFKYHVLILSLHATTHRLVPYLLEFAFAVQPKSQDGLAAPVRHWKILTGIKELICQKYHINQELNNNANISPNWLTSLSKTKCVLPYKNLRECLVCHQGGEPKVNFHARCFSRTIYSDLWAWRAIQRVLTEQTPACFISKNPVGGLFFTHI